MRSIALEAVLGLHVHTHPFPHTCAPRTHTQKERREAESGGGDMAQDISTKQVEVMVVWVKS